MELKMRTLLAFALLLLPTVALAVEAPSGQVRVEDGKVLRGNFVEEREIKGVEEPLRLSGSFLAAPGKGLLWNIEKPVPTSTVITREGAYQKLGGLSMKLQVKKLAHLYDMVSKALAGNWQKLENEFEIAQSGSGERWQMVLTPRRGVSAKLPYASISVSGGRFVENIVMTRTDGISDALTFTNEVLSPAQLTQKELALFTTN
jgi:hypothetical protein